MHCSSCGAKMENVAVHCPECGAPRGGPAQSPFAAQPASSYASGAPAPTYLVPSILVTLFCCQIFGIVAIVYAAIATGKNSSGDYVGAQQAGSTAKMWCWLGFGIGLVFVLGYAVLAMAGTLASSGTTP